MIKIESKKKKVKEDDGSEKDIEFLLINGIPDEDSYFRLGKVKYAHFYNDEVISLLLNNSFYEIGKYFSLFIFDLDEDWWDNWIKIEIYCNTYYDTKIPRIKIDLHFQDWENWSKPWSMSAIAKQFEVNVLKLANDKIKYWQEEDSILNGFGVEYFPSNNKSIIDTELSYFLEIIETLVNKTNQELLTSIDSEAVVTYFNFPAEIKTACKQYLLYFTQFIADMGVEVDSEIKEELNHTLFKVVPINKNESLERIREALNIYLNAPGDKKFQVQVAEQNDIAVKQWEANIYHLKSQLSLAASIIQAKDSTIEMLQLSNYQYKQLLESQSSKRDSDKEEIIEGIVTIKKYEGKGFSIDLAEIFRRLKRIIKK